MVKLKHLALGAFMAVILSQMVGASMDTNNSPAIDTNIPLDLNLIMPDNNSQNTIQLPTDNNAPSVNNAPPDTNQITPDSNLPISNSGLVITNSSPIKKEKNIPLDNNAPPIDNNSTPLDNNTPPNTTLNGITPGWHNVFTSLDLNCVDSNGDSCAFTSFNINNAGTPTNTITDGIPGLIHSWTFDQILPGNVVKDNVGTANGTTRFATFVPGHNGNAMLYSNNFPADKDHIGSDLNVGIDNNILGIGDFTVCAWISMRNIQPNINPTDSNDLTAKLNGMTDRIISNGVTIFYATYGDTPGTYKLNETNNDPLAQYPAGSASEILLNKWQNVCLTRNSSGAANFYVDGHLSGPANQTGGGVPTNTPNPNNPNKYVHIGNQENFDLNKFFDGNIDDVRIYDRILAADEINKIYFFGKTWTDGNTISLNTDSNFKIDYFGTDKNGTKENVQTAYYAIDTTPPKITDLNASLVANSVSLNYSATDNLSGINKYQLSMGENNWIDSTDTNFKFTGLNDANHTFFVRAIDNANNISADANISVTIVKTDVNAPVIILTGDNPEIIQVNTPYIELGAIAVDNIDANAPATPFGTVDTNKLGSYTVRYDANDSSGNKAVEVTRTVNVVDTTPPVITLIGDNPLTIALGNPYTEKGATAIDNYDGNLDANILIDSNSVNTGVAGTYTVKYDVNDSSKNMAIEAVRTINVVAPQENPQPTSGGGGGSYGGGGGIIYVPTDTNKKSVNDQNDTNASTKQPPIQIDSNGANANTYPDGNKIKPAFNQAQNQKATTVEDNSQPLNKTTGLFGLGNYSSIGLIAGAILVLAIIGMFILIGNKSSEGG